MNLTLILKYLLQGTCIWALISLNFHLQASPNTSLKLEIERSLDKGLNWLHGEQNATDGYWGSSQYPALTALVLRATLGHPSVKETKKYREQITEGFKFLQQ